jgi:hypothetical protein
MRKDRLATALAASCLAASQLACIATEPFPPPPAEVLVVVNRDDHTLTLIPVAAPTTQTTIPLGSASPVPAGLAASEGIALVPLGDDDAVAVVDLAAGTVLDTYGLPANSGATGAAIVDDSIGYVANPGLNSVTRINFLTGDTASVDVGVRPLGVVFTRGRLFVINANSDGAGDPLGESWITVIDPTTNVSATGIDSIPLPGPGNARHAAVGADGLLYVVSAGDSGTGEGRLSIVNPVTREELGSFGGFGNFPATVATLGSRIFITNRAEGLMEFDGHSRTTVRGAGDAVGPPGVVGVAVGSGGRVFTLQVGSCGAADATVVTRRSNLTQSGSVGAGECAVALLMATVPAEP